MTLYGPNSSSSELLSGFNQFCFGSQNFERGHEFPFGISDLEVLAETFPNLDLNVGCEGSTSSWDSGGVISANSSTTLSTNFVTTRDLSLFLYFGFNKQAVHASFSTFGSNIKVSKCIFILAMKSATVSVVVAGSISLCSWS